MYVGERSKIPMLKLSKTTQSGVKPVAEKRDRARRGLGKGLQGMLRPITILQKKNRFGLGYKLDKRGRQRLVEEKKEKRIASFLGKERESAKMDIPPLSCSIRSVDFINFEVIQGNEKKVMVDVAETFESLSIDMVEVEDQEASNAGLPPFPRGQVLNNLTSIELLVVFKFQDEDK